MRILTDFELTQVGAGGITPDGLIDYREFYGIPVQNFAPAVMVDVSKAPIIDQIMYFTGIIKVKQVCLSLFNGFF